MPYVFDADVLNQGPCLCLCCCRHHEDMADLPMAIGPWHARVHKASCQRDFGARHTPNTGLTYGDNIEHLWAFLRKFAHLLKYQSEASRQDFLTSLVSLLGLIYAHTISHSECRHLIAWFLGKNEKISVVTVMRPLPQTSPLF